MINLFRNCFQRRVPRGAATLIFAVVLIVICTLIIIFAANYGRMQEASVTNQVRGAQAFEAAEAGMEFGIAYLRQNAATVIANPVSGHFTYTNASLTDVALGNGSRFSVSYTNPVANNYELIEITSTGVNDDDTSTRIVRQQVQFGTLLMSPPTNTITSKGSVTLTGSAVVANTSNTNTIVSASTVSFGGNAETVLSTGTSSYAGNIGADIQQNNNALDTQSNDAFFSSIFGTTDLNVIQSQFQHKYTNSSDTNYAGTLDGMQGTSIWINQTGTSVANFSGNATIGSATNPVLMVVNGPLTVTGNVTVYGFIFVIGPSGISNLMGNISVIGGMATTDDLTITGNANITFNPTILENIRNNPAMRYYAKVPGTWKDF